MVNVRGKGDAAQRNDDLADRINKNATKTADNLATTLTSSISSAGMTEDIKNNIASIADRKADKLDAAGKLAHVQRLDGRYWSEKTSRSATPRCSRD